MLQQTIVEAVVKLAAGGGAVAFGRVVDIDLAPLHGVALKLIRVAEQREGKLPVAKLGGLGRLQVCQVVAKSRALVCGCKYLHPHTNARLFANDFGGWEDGRQLLRKVLI